MKASVLALAILALAGLGLPAEAARQEGWPCIQRKVPKLTPGAYWNGPSIEGLSWRDDREVANLVAGIVSRRTPEKDAEQMIADFAKKHEAEKEQKLTLLFAGVFHEINALRSDIISGIERFMKNQEARADQLTKARAELEALAEKPDKTEADMAKLNELQTAVQWLIRIYDDRESTLTYICETPVLLEQRLFALARAIQSHLSTSG